MRQVQYKWALAIAALGLVLGGATTAYGLWTSLLPRAAPDAAPSRARLTAAPAPLAERPPVRVGALTAADIDAFAGALGGAAPSPGAAPQYDRYRSYSDARAALAGNRHEFYFTRGIYSSYRGYGRRRGGSWATDYPKADIQFLYGLKRITNINAYDYENAVMLTDPELRRYPFLYMLEVGNMQLSPEEVEGLRDYLAAGGFLFIDDFWGTYEWQVFEWEIHRVLPGSQIVELPLDHPLFSVFYDIREILQVPNVGNGRSGWGTSEKDGYVPHVRAIFDDNGRMLVLINWNTDLGDAWEWAEDPYYPLIYSNYAYHMATNAIIYAMSH